MARVARSPRGAPGTLRVVADDLERPSTGGGFKVLAIIAIVIVGWLVLLPVLSLARSLIPLALYVIIAVVAYQVGKVVGRRDEDET